VSAPGDRTKLVIGDVLRGAFDDVGVRRLGPRSEAAVIERVVELLTLAGYELVHEPAGAQAAADSAIDVA
jgi:hypothetical protein